MMAVKIFLTKIIVPIIMEALASKILGRWLESQVLFYESGGFDDADAADDDNDYDDDDKEKVRLCFTREQSGGSDRYSSQIASHSATTLTRKYTKKHKYKYKNSRSLCDNADTQIHKYTKTQIQIH